MPPAKPKIKKICPHCKKIFLVHPSRTWRKYCSLYCVHNSTERKRLAEKNLLKGCPCGKDNPNWKGGKTSEAEKIRKSKEYKEWRKQVFKRDNYTCVFCGKWGGRLNADHIKPFADYPELRLDINNGRTLCEICHKKLITWMNNSGKCGFQKKIKLEVK